MKTPLISLIIPTRERCDTLRFSLQTALNQKSENYEIVVSDNFSQDDTRKIVESFDDPRIKYFNTGKHVSMCDNWDFACEKARGEFIIIIGDDDGIMPGAIEKLEKLIHDQPSLIYFWKQHRYVWPVEGKKAEIDFFAFRTKLRRVDLKKAVRSPIEWGFWKLSDLPMLYHSVVSKSLLDEVKQATGRVFHTLNPDFFMGFALPVYADMAIDVGESLTVNGRSSKSNSGSWISKSSKKATIKRFSHEYPDYQYHKTSYPGWPFPVNIVVDTPLVTMDMFPEFYKDMKFDYIAIWAAFQRQIGSGRDIIGLRKEINLYHPFSVVKFITYFTFLSLKKPFVKLWYRRQRLRRRKMNAEGVPSNIFDFVNFMAKN